MSRTNKKEIISKPLFKQSLKSNFILWLVLTLGSAGIFVLINLVVGTKTIFTNIDMNSVQDYVKDEGLNWLQILGLLEQMGFSLSRIQTMSQIDLNSVMNDLVYKSIAFSPRSYDLWVLIKYKPSSHHLLVKPLTYYR